MIPVLIYWQWICSQIPKIVLNFLYTVFLVIYTYDQVYLISEAHSTKLAALCNNHIKIIWVKSICLKILIEYFQFVVE